MTMSEGELAVAEIGFVRREQIAPQPPPAPMTVMRVSFLVRMAAIVFSTLLSASGECA